MHSMSFFDQSNTEGEGTSYGFPIAPQATQQTQPQQMQPQQMEGMQQMPGQPQVPQAPIPGAGPVDFEMLPSTPIMDIEYTQGYLKSQIGARIKVEFLIGTDMFVDREGTLVDVGISYIVIREVDTDDLLLCDIYSIKFVRFYY